MFGESFKFFDPPTTKWWSFKFLAKLNGTHILMTIFSKLSKYQTFGLIELHNLSKGQLDDRISKLWKSCVYVYRAAEHTIDFQSSDKVLPLHQHLWSEIFRQWSNSPLKPFWHLHGRAFLLLKFCKRREILKAQFLLILLKYIVVGYSNGNGCLTGGLFSKLRDVEYSVPFFYISHL